MLELKHDAAVRVVVITGRATSRSSPARTSTSWRCNARREAKEHALRGQHVFDLIENLGKPVIAAINGYALGGGCELAMACTLRIAADTARLGQPEINLGIIRATRGTQRLARLVGKGVALDLLLTGRQITRPRSSANRSRQSRRPAAELMSEAKRARRGAWRRRRLLPCSTSSRP